MTWQLGVAEVTEFNIRSAERHLRDPWSPIEVEAYLWLNAQPDSGEDVARNIFAESRSMSGDFDLIDPVLSLQQPVHGGMEVVLVDLGIYRPRQNGRELEPCSSLAEEYVPFLGRPRLPSMRSAARWAMFANVFFLTLLSFR